jgi:hypothetical protein
MNALYMKNRTLQGLTSMKKAISISIYIFLTSFFNQLLLQGKCKNMRFTVSMICMGYLEFGQEIRPEILYLVFVTSLNI